MFLKSLTLKGFKSFAETANLEFEPGVTVVVGPNGSGKSNIVDAVAWVLGAQGARALRGAKMEDVIFAGTAKRSGLGRAEVSLTIDNSAGLLPIDFTEVKITRVLWRSGESEYSINNVPCRLLDIQDLLSDTGVGRQQHTIISQSQLDSVLSARPEDRRMVIEEAAGISKHRRRKEKAQRKLESTENDLLRVQDLLKEVRRQLRPLERQAQAAQRHAVVLDELTALRRFLHGRELSALKSRLQALDQTRQRLSHEEGEALGELERMSAQMGEAEVDLGRTRQEAEATDLAEMVSAAEGLRARASGLVALMEERARRIERDRAATIDKDVVSSLEAEAASLAAQLAATDDDVVALLPVEQELAAAEEGLAREAEEVEARYSARDTQEPAAAGTAFGRGRDEAVEEVGSAANRAGEVRAELAARRRATEQLANELRRLTARAESLEARRARLAAEVERAQSALQGAEAAAPGLAQALAGAVEALSVAEQAVGPAEEARRAADAERHRWAARAEALAQALDEARARAGARRLAGVDGMVGALVELVDVDEGWEAAFEAAAGEALSAVLMDGAASARRALAHLSASRAGGAVIALPDHEPSATPARHADDPPQRAHWLRSHVRSGRPEVSGLLDLLLSLAVVVDGDWAAAVDVSEARPDLVVVTRAGDRCAGGIWRTGSSGTGATGAALEEARGALAKASTSAQAATSAERQAKATLEHCRSTHADARRASADNAAARRSAGEALQRASSDLAEVAAEAEATAQQHSELAARAEAEQARLSELSALLPGLEEAAAQEQRRVQQLREEQQRRASEERAARARLAERANAVATLRRDLEVRASGIEERRALLARRREEVERRLEGNLAERDEAARRRAALEATALAVARLRAFIEPRRQSLEEAVRRLRDQRRAQTEALRSVTETVEALRRQHGAVDRRLAAVREQAGKLDVEEAQLRGRLEALVETVHRDLECEPDELEGAVCPELPEGTSAPNRARDLERELRLMGPVNPLALEEYAELEERHKFLEAQSSDVSNARRELAKVIKAIDAQIIVDFKSAYDDVADNFTLLVTKLFPGGHGSLSLTDESSILDSGIEIEVKPVGKNVKRLSLLSGGERSLVALAFLFAVFRSRPSPFYMMDEVESALDDVNLSRFLELVGEFRDEAQLLIVSHQKRTMEAANCLYGVTMPPGGSSIVVSERVQVPEGREPAQPEPAKN